MVAQLHKESGNRGGESVARYPSPTKRRGLPRNLMKRILIRPLVAALILAGCVCSTPSFADSAADASQTQALKEAYARGYQAAMVAAVSRAAPPASGSAAPSPPSATPVVRKPILDIKESYSDAGDVETVQVLPVTATPLPNAPPPRTSIATLASAAPPAPLPPSVAPAVSTYAAQVAPLTPQEQQEVQAAIAQIRAWGDRLAAPRAAQPAAASAPLDPPDDDASAEEQLPDPRPPTRYVQSYPGTRDPQPVYQEGQPVAYTPPSARTYAAPPPPWVSRNQPPPQTDGRMYWSPEYGRWLYY